MCAAPDRTPRKINSVKRRKLFSDEGGTSGLTTQMGSVFLSEDERAARRKRLSTSKSVDDMEAEYSEVEEGSCVSRKCADEVHAPLYPEDEGSDKEAFDILGDDNADQEECKTLSDSNSVGEVTPKRSLRIRTPIKNSTPKSQGKRFANGEQDWSSEEKETLLSILDNEGFDGDFQKLAEKIPNKSLESVRYLVDKFEEKRKKPDWKLMLDSKIEELRLMEGAHLAENLPLAFQLHSLYGVFPDPSLVGGVDYSAIYAHMASLMRGEVPKQLNSATSAKFSQLFLLFQERIQSEPEKPVPKFERNKELNIERKKNLFERRSNDVLPDEKRAEDALLSGDIARIEEFYMSQASLNPN